MWRVLQFSLQLHDTLVINFRLKQTELWQLNGTFNMSFLAIMHKKRSFYTLFKVLNQSDKFLFWHLFCSEIILHLCLWIPRFSKDTKMPQALCHSFLRVLHQVLQSLDIWKFVAALLPTQFNFFTLVEQE